MRRPRGSRRRAQSLSTTASRFERRLAARDPDNAEWQRDLSVSYDRIGDISAARGDRDGALKAYKDGLEIGKKLAARDPGNAEWQRDLSVSYDRIGDICAVSRPRRRFEPCRKALRLQKLAALDPNNSVAADLRKL